MFTIAANSKGGVMNSRYGSRHTRDFETKWQRQMQY